MQSGTAVPGSGIYIFARGLKGRSIDSSGRSPRCCAPLCSEGLALLRDFDWDDARRSWPLAARNPELPVLKYWCMFRSGARSRFAINQACRAGFLPTSRSRTSSRNG